jgi:hypothetical protein
MIVIGNGLSGSKCLSGTLCGVRSGFITSDIFIEL